MPPQPATPATFDRRTGLLHHSASAGAGAALAAGSPGGAGLAGGHSGGTALPVLARAAARLAGSSDDSVCSAAESTRSRFESVNRVAVAAGHDYVVRRSGCRRRSKEPRRRSVEGGPDGAGGAARTPRASQALSVLGQQVEAEQGEAAAVMLQQPSRLAGWRSGTAAQRLASASAPSFFVDGEERERQHKEADEQAERRRSDTARGVEAWVEAAAAASAAEDPGAATALGPDAAADTACCEPQSLAERLSAARGAPATLSARTRPASFALPVPASASQPTPPPGSPICTSLPVGSAGKAATQPPSADKPARSRCWHLSALGRLLRF